MALSVEINTFLILYIASVASLQENIFEGESGFQIGTLLTVLTSLVVGSTLFLCFAEKEGGGRYLDVVAVRAFKRPKQSKISRETASAMTRLRALTVGTKDDRESDQNKEDVEMTSSLKLARPEIIDPIFDDINLGKGAEERLSVQFNESHSMNPLAAAKQEQRRQSLGPATSATTFEGGHGEKYRDEVSSSLEDAQQGGVGERASPPVVISTNTAPISDVKWTQQVDEVTGKTYYYSDTGEVTWNPVSDAQDAANGARDEESEFDERFHGLGETTTAL